jgi:hypothetical protein
MSWLEHHKRSLGQLERRKKWKPKRLLGRRKKWKPKKLLGRRKK